MINSNQLLLLLTVAAIAGLLIGVMVPMPVSAEDTNNTTAEESSDIDTDEIDDEVMRDVSDVLTVRDIEWGDDEVVLTVDADTSHTVWVSILETDDSGYMYDYQLSPGITEITVPHDASEVSVTSQNQFVQFGTGSDTRIGEDGVNPVFVASAAVIMTLLVILALYIRDTRDDDDEGALNSIR